MIIWWVFIKPASISNCVFVYYFDVVKRKVVSYLFFFILLWQNDFNVHYYFFYRTTLVWPAKTVEQLQMENRSQWKIGPLLFPLWIRKEKWMIVIVIIIVCAHRMYLLESRCEWLRWLSAWHPANARWAAHFGVNGSFSSFSFFLLWQKRNPLFFLQWLSFRKHFSLCKM